MRCPACCPAAARSSDASAREQTAAAWNVDELPTAAGRDTAAILAAARGGELGALLIGGVELADLPDPDAALAAVDAAPFVVSLELRESAVTELRRRGVPGRAGGGEGRLVHQLGGPDSAVRAVAAHQRHTRICGC